MFAKIKTHKKDRLFTDLTRIFFGFSLKQNFISKTLNILSIIRSNIINLKALFVILLRLDRKTDFDRFCYKIDGDLEKDTEYFLSQEFEEDDIGLN